MLAIVACGVYGVDQLAKFGIVRGLVPGERVEVLGSLLQFHYVANSGAAFSVGAGMTWIFSLVAIGVVVFIVVYARRIRAVSWGLVFGLLLGGTLGNLTDRLFRPPSFGQGHVVDFLQVWGFPAIFNVADSAIVVSMVLFVIVTIRGVRLDGTRVARRARSSDASISD